MIPSHFYRGQWSQFRADKWYTPRPFLCSGTSLHTSVAFVSVLVSTSGSGGVCIAARQIAAATPPN